MYKKIYMYSKVYIRHIQSLCMSYINFVYDVYKLCVCTYLKIIKKEKHHVYKLCTFVYVNTYIFKKPKN